MTIVAPKKRAKTMSRTRPRIRDRSVIALTTDVDFSKWSPERRLWRLGLCSGALLPEEVSSGIDCDSGL